MTDRIFSLKKEGNIGYRNIQCGRRRHEYVDGSSGGEFS